MSQTTPRTMEAASLIATYLVRCAREHVSTRAEGLMLEQTVEVSRAALAYLKPEVDLSGHVVSKEEVGECAYRVTIALPVAATGGDAAQLVNVLFGNSSMQHDVELADVQVPDSLALQLRGPRFGIEGWRAATGATDRALTCAAIKPLGASAQQLADLAATYARAGVDVIKDDHALADQEAAPFAERVRLVMEALERVARETGRATLYAPHLVGGPTALRRQARVARDLGVGAVLVAPMLVGLPVLHDLVRGPDPLGLPVLAHPAMSGAPRIAPEVLLGTLFPLCGADAVIFPHAGGRFPISEATCQTLGNELCRPRAAIAPALPVPAGGMRRERVAELLRFYGKDVMLLVGGSVLDEGAEVEERVRAFVRAAQEGREKSEG